MELENVFDILNATFPALSKSGKRIAEYIFNHKMDVQYMTITSLAEECNVSEATITRFCKSLDYNSYSAFKIALAKASGLHTNNNLLSDGQDSDEILPSDSIIEMSRKLSILDTNAITHTLQLLNPENISRAVQYLLDAQRVFCFGQGASCIIAMESWVRFSIVSPHFQTIEDSHMQTVAASTCNSHDVILFFSYSGATRDMMDVLPIAKKRGAKIILVSRYQKSPAAAYADVILLCGSNESPLQVGSIAAKIGQLFVIDVLFNEYCRQNAEFTSHNCELTAAATAAKLL